MKKIFLIGWKDLTLAFRDTAALILMLAAPFVLTLGLGFVTGRFSGGSSGGLSDIPVILVNLDGGQLGNALVEVFTSEDLADLVEPQIVSDPAAARTLIDDNQAAAAIIIPAGFTRSIIPDSTNPGSGPASDLPLPTGEQAVIKVEIYANPGSPTSAGVLQTIVEEFFSRVEIGRVSGEVTVVQLMTSGLVAPQDMEKIGSEIGERQAVETQSEPAIEITTNVSQQETQEFDVLAYLAPGMALMFLMYTVSYGGRSILTERSQGTLPRLLVSPTSTAQVFGGKVLGIFLTGVAQMLILIGASTLLFNLKWGDPLAVLVLVLAAVFGATGWGMLITAIARTPAQISSVGSAIMLTFGILGGTFISLNNLPVYVQWISKITPNAWGLDGFTILGLGGGLPQIMTPLIALLIMGVLLFGAAVALFNRNNILQ